MHLKQVQNTVWENVFKYKYSIFVFWKYTKYIWNWPSSEVTLLRPVYTKNDNYKGNYISAF